MQTHLFLSSLHRLLWEMITTHILPSVCKRWGKAAGYVARWKATGEARRVHQSSPQHLQCVWMSRHLLMAPCWPSAHHPDLHCDGRSAGGLSQAGGCWCLRSWSPLSTRNAHPDRQRRPLLLAEGLAQTWGGQQRKNMGQGVCTIKCVPLFIIPSVCCFVHRQTEKETGKRCTSLIVCLPSPVWVQRHTELFSRESCSQTCWSFKNFEWD